MFHQNSLQRAKRIADELDRELRSIGIRLRRKQVLETVATMLEWPGWSSMAKSAGNHPPSLDDHECDDAEVRRRQEQQVKPIEALGIRPEVARAIVQRLRPTGRSEVARAASEALRDPEIKKQLDLCHFGISEGMWEAVGSIATSALKSCKPLAKGAFVEVLEACAPHDPASAVNLAVSKAVGEGTERDFEGAVKLVGHAIEMLESGEGPEDAKDLLVHARMVMGDLLTGMHSSHMGAERNGPDAFRQYALGAELGSPVAAFKAALVLSKQEAPNFREIERLYRIAAGQGMAEAMMNLALMITRGEAPGGQREADVLIRTAAALGDDIALDVLSKHKRMPKDFVRGNLVIALAEGGHPGMFYPFKAPWMNSGRR